LISEARFAPEFQATLIIDGVSEVPWVVRHDYCDTKDAQGINYHYTGVSDESLHVVTLREELGLGSVDCEVMSAWCLRTVTEPDTIQSRVEKANFVADVPGVTPYPCEVAS
jgi:hypothetical protein